jgi:hypothetical protein
VLQVLEAALQSQLFGVRLSGVVTSGAVLQLCPDALPTKPVAAFTRFLAPYYHPKLPMPIDPNRDETYDSAFGDPGWAKTFRADPKVLKALRATLGTVVGVWAAGKHVRGSPDRRLPVPVASHPRHGRWQGPHRAHAQVCRSARTRARAGNVGGQRWTSAPPRKARGRPVCHECHHLLDRRADLGRSEASCAPSNKFIRSNLFAHRISNWYRLV